jgi:uncharacterized membrane protein
MSKVIPMENIFFGFLDQPDEIEHDNDNFDFLIFLTVLSFIVILISVLLIEKTRNKKFSLQKNEKIIPTSESKE